MLLKLQVLPTCMSTGSMLGNTQNNSLSSPNPQHAVTSVVTVVVYIRKRVNAQPMASNAIHAVRTITSHAAVDRRSKGDSRHQHRIADSNKVPIEHNQQTNAMSTNSLSMTRQTVTSSVCTSSATHVMVISARVEPST